MIRKTLLTGAIPGSEKSPFLFLGPENIPVETLKNKIKTKNNICIYIDIHTYWICIQTHIEQTCSHGYAHKCCHQKNSSQFWWWNLSCSHIVTTINRLPTMQGFKRNISFNNVLIGLQTTFPQVQCRGFSICVSQVVVYMFSVVQ